MRADRYPPVLPALVAVALVLSTIPSFFAIYRDAAFQTTPRDDYAPALLALIGERGDPPFRQATTLGAAPYGYRILSLAAAIPFYGLLPYYAFSNLETTDEHYLRATAALSMVSYLSILLTVLVSYLVARRRLKCSTEASLLAALLSFGLFQFMAVGGIDPLAMLVVSLLVLFIDHPVVFASLILASVVANEKIAIVFTLLFALRFALWLRARSPSFQFVPQTVSTGVAVVAYVAILELVPLEAHPAHTDPTRWLSGAMATLESSLSFKGAIQNGLPIVVMAVVMFVVYMTWQRRPRVPGFSPIDLAVAPALLVIGFLIDAQFTVGRLVMYSFPLYLPLLAFVIDDELTKRRVRERAPA